MTVSEQSSPTIDSNGNVEPIVSALKCETKIVEKSADGEKAQNVAPPPNSPTLKSYEKVCGDENDDILKHSSLDASEEKNKEKSEERKTNDSDDDVLLLTSSSESNENDDVIVVEDGEILGKLL